MYQFVIFAIKYIVSIKHFFIFIHDFFWLRSARRNMGEEGSRPPMVNLDVASGAARLALSFTPVIQIRTQEVISPMCGYL